MGNRQTVKMRVKKKWNLSNGGPCTLLLGLQWGENGPAERVVGGHRRGDAEIAEPTAGERAGKQESLSALKLHNLEIFEYICKTVLKVCMQNRRKSI